MRKGPSPLTCSYPIMDLMCEAGPSTSPQGRKAPSLYSVTASMAQWLRCPPPQRQTWLQLPPRWPSGKASASRAEDPGFESRLRRDFFGVESYQ